MSQDNSRARTSHAHAVEPLKDGKLAEASTTVQQQLAKAAEFRQAQPTRAQETERTGSMMVRQAGPKQNLPPPPSVRHEVDRLAHLSALSRDFARAKELNDRAKALHTRHKEAELKQEREAGYEMGR